MEQNTFLIDTYNLENLIFKKPKKIKDFLVSKVKYLQPGEKAEKPFMVQFPKMKIVSLEKNIELEFKDDRGYSKKMYNALTKVDSFVIDSIAAKSEEWFEKKIPTASVRQMYNTFIKPPKTSESKCTLNFGLHKDKEFVDHRGDPLELNELCTSAHLQVIAEMKYIIFSKDSSFVQWEIHTGKMQKKIHKVPKNGFVEDPDDLEDSDSDSEPEIHCFF